MNIRRLYINYILFQLQIYLIYSHFFTISPLLNQTKLGILQNKNKYKIDKICDIVKINRPSNEKLIYYTYLKYYYDFFRPYRRVCDFNRIVYFKHLTNFKKTALLIKIVFYTFYYSL